MDLQLWFELHEAPTPEQRELLEAVINSWFTVGRLGGFNAQNLQVRSLVLEASTVTATLQPPQCAYEPNPAIDLAACLPPQTLIKQGRLTTARPIGALQGWPRKQQLQI